MNNNKLLINPYLLNYIFNYINKKDKDFQIKFLLIIVLLVELNARGRAGIRANKKIKKTESENNFLEISVSQLYKKYFLSRNERIIVSKLKEILSDILINGFGTLQFSSNIKNNIKNKNEIIKIYEINKGIPPVYKYSNIILTNEELKRIINITNEAKEIKIETLIIIYLYLKYINYLSLKNKLYENNCSSNAFTVTYRTIEEHTGISRQSVKKYITCLEDHQMLYSYWVGKYNKNTKNTQSSIRSAPMIYCFEKDTEAVYQKIQSLKKMLMDNNNNYNNLFFSNYNSIPENW